MKSICPKCGEVLVVNTIGRKPLDIGVINVCDSLQGCSSVAAAARKLKVSRGYIYKHLRAEGLEPLSFVKRKKIIIQS